ncbi:MAG: peptidylprolyl isomerase, partial [candidate division Zixibacteria bacterium]|nr:peptidylprolyl isomerase [candidate division Zixibacteria bacterium]
LQRKLEEERFGQIRVTGLEVQKYFETYQDSLPQKQSLVSLSHIMMTVKPGPEREAAVRERITRIAQQIREGGDFAEAARQYSEDLASAKNGGDLGFFSRGTFVDAFEDAAFSLKPGETSDIVRTRFGFHLIRKEEQSGDQVRVRHIFLQLSLKPEDDVRTEQQLAFLRERILSGRESFENAARKYSEDIESSEKGGSIGEYNISELQPLYQSIVDTLDVAAVSMPVKIQDAGETTYHLLRIDKRTGGGKLNIQDDYETVSNLARQNKWQKERKRWLNDLRAELHIDERGFANTASGAP